MRAHLSLVTNVRLQFTEGSHDARDAPMQSSIATVIYILEGGSKLYLIAHAKNILTWSLWTDSWVA